jgi:hypothetical protein
MTTLRTDDRKAGWTFLAGSLGGIVTMAIHPTGAGALSPEQVDHLALISGIAHSIAMVSFLLMFLGAIGLTRRLASFEAEGRQDRLALAGLVAYGFGVVALLLATAVSGFIIPGILLRSVHDTAANAPQWHMMMDAVFEFNQSFARIYSVAASVAIVLWSASSLRNRVKRQDGGQNDGQSGLGRGIATFGCVVAPVIVVLIAVGHLRLNVHGMAVVVLAHAIWFIVVGVQLVREREIQPVNP